jgi:CHAT domain-containing protein
VAQVDAPTRETQEDSISTSSSEQSKSDVVSAIEESFTRQFEEYLGESVKTPAVTLVQARDILHKVEEGTGVKPALIYVTFVPQGATRDERSGVLSPIQDPNLKSKNSQDQLELLLVTAEGSPIRVRVDGTTREKVFKVADDFRSGVTNVRSRRDYLPAAKQLYQWVVEPLEADLKARGIRNLTFLLDTGLRSVPMAALHDGQEFLVEKYSIGLMPSLTLSDTRYKDVKNSQVLAMGSAKFTDLRPLPAVPVELATITPSLWKGKSFLNDAFTLDNIKAQRKQQPFGIIHLATHASFQPGTPSNSYIELWNSKLRLNQLSELGWDNPAVELLVLSACRTALGDEQAELGFAGLAVQAGVKSAIASLWSVSDEGTLGLMAQLYQQLKQAPIKGEALRQAQISMIRGQVQLSGGQLMSGTKSVSLPAELSKLGNKKLEHPYYWAAFTMIGNPW